MEQFKPADADLDGKLNLEEFNGHFKLMLNPLT